MRAVSLRVGRRGLDCYVNGRLAADDCRSFAEARDVVYDALVKDGAQYDEAGRLTMRAVRQAAKQEGRRVSPW